MDSQSHLLQKKKATCKATSHKAKPPRGTGLPELCWTRPDGVKLQLPPLRRKLSAGSHRRDTQRAPCPALPSLKQESARAAASPDQPAHGQHLQSKALTNTGAKCCAHMAERSQPWEAQAPAIASTHVPQESPSRS